MIWLPVQRRREEFVRSDELRFKKQNRGEMDLLKLRLAQDDIESNKDEFKKLQKNLENLQKARDPRDLRSYLLFPDAGLTTQGIQKPPEIAKAPIVNQSQLPLVKPGDYGHGLLKPMSAPGKSRGISLERPRGPIVTMGKLENQPRSSSQSRAAPIPPPNSWPFFLEFAEGCIARSGAYYNKVDDEKDPIIRENQVNKDFFGVPSSRSKHNYNPINHIDDEIKDVSESENRVGFVTPEYQGHEYQGHDDGTSPFGDNTDKLEGLKKLVGSNMQIQPDGFKDYFRKFTECFSSLKGPINLTVHIGTADDSKNTKNPVGSAVSRGKTVD